MLNLELGVDDMVGGLANTRVGSYLYPQEIKRLKKGFVLLLHQPDRKLGMTSQCVNFNMKCIGKVCFRYAFQSDYICFYSLIT
jgi:hypothetical protein